MWLEKPSLNQIDPTWNPADKSNHAKITIKMTPYKPEHPTLRAHKIKVGLFKQDMTVDVLEVLLHPQ